MAKVTKRFLGLALAGIMSVGSIAALGQQLGTASAKEVEVSAQEVKVQEKSEHPQLRSNALYQIKSTQGNAVYYKIIQIINSIKNNYAGEKNQPTWQQYIKEARTLINKIPSKYKEDAVELSKHVDWLENFVNYVAKMNHVEKSYATNYKGIKNAAQWQTYLSEARKEREKITYYYKEVEVIIHKVDEVDSRYNAIVDKVNTIIKAYNDDLTKVYGKYILAYDTGDLELAKEALEDAKKLGTHESTTKAINDINALIKALS